MEITYEFRPRPDIRRTVVKARKVYEECGIKTMIVSSASDKISYRGWEVVVVSPSKLQQVLVNKLQTAFGDGWDITSEEGHIRIQFEPDKGK